MFLNVDYYDPQTLTGYARANLADLDINQFTLARWLPNQPVDDLDFRFTKGGETLIEAATFRTWDTEAPIAARPGGIRTAGELPPISRKIPLDEYTRLKQRSNGDAGIQFALLKDTERMTHSIAARMELARGQALATAHVTINENGVQADVDFGRRSSHTVTAAASWATASTDIINDLLVWVQTYVDNNGQVPAAILMSRKTAGYFIRNDKFRNLLAAGLVAQPTVVSKAAVSRVLSDYDLPPIETYDATVNVGGVATKVIPEDKVILVPSAQLGATLYGLTAEAISSDYNITASEAPGIVAGAWETKDPINLWTKANAIGLPIMVNPDLTFCADVIP